MSDLQMLREDVKRAEASISHLVHGVVADLKQRHPEVRIDGVRIDMLRLQTMGTPDDYVIGQVEISVELKK